MDPSKPTAKPENRDKIRVFVSYSRKDSQFVDRLGGEFESRGIEPLLDRQQIASLEDWWKRITVLIGQAHSVVFVLSPDWLKSEVCQKELELALAMNKRLAPILRASLPPGQAPQALSKLNWILFEKEADFSPSLRALVAALDTDIDWIREQTRIGELARHWDRDERPEGALLREDVLVAAERLLAKRPINAPLPTELLLEYLRESRTASEQEIQARKDLLDRTQISQSRMLAERAKELLQRGDAVSAILLCLEALPDEAAGIVRPYVEEAEFVCYNALAARREERVLACSGSKPTDAVFSDDGTRLMVVTDKGLSVWDASTATLLTSVEGERVVITSDGSRAATIEKEAIRIWAIQTPGEGAKLLVSFAVNNRSWWWKGLGENQRCWVEMDGKLQFGKLQPGQVSKGSTLLPLRKSVPIKEDYDEIAFSPDGRRMVTTPLFNYSFPTTVCVWDARSGKKIADLAGHNLYVGSAQFSADGAMVATASGDGTARIWDASTGKLLKILRGHDQAVASARFSTDATMVATAAFDNTVRLWHRASGQEVALLRGHVGDVPNTTDLFKGFVPGARFSDDGKKVVTTWKDDTVRIWSVEADGLSRVFTGHKRKIDSVAFAPQGTHFATGSKDKTIKLWDTAGKGPLFTLCESGDEISDLAFRPGGTELVAAVDECIIIWNIDSRKELARIETGDDISSIAVSPDGRLVATTSLSGTATVWDIATAKKISTFDQGDSSYGVDFAPSGLVAVSCGDERAVRLWNVKTGREIARAIFHGTSVLDVSFDPGGRRVATACDDRTSAIWTIGTEPSPDNVVVLSGHTKSVLSVAFNPHREQMVTASEDGTVRLWNSLNGQQIACFSGHSDRVTKAIFSPSGRQVVSVSWDATVRVWEIFPDTEALVDFAKQAVPRVLTPEQRRSFFLDEKPPSWHIDRMKWPFDCRALKQVRARGRESA